MMKFPLFKNFMAVNIRNAFILNSICGALSAIVALHSDAFFRKTIDSIDIHTGATQKSHLKELVVSLLSFISTCFVTFLVYSFLYVTIGFGGSMLTSCKDSECVWS